MNLDVKSSTTATPAAILLEAAPDSVRLVPRIERCEFETLLQRAMEILNARHLAAQLTAERR